MKDSKIEWTDHTLNLWWGCTKVHAGCDNCYAESLSTRFGDDVWGNGKPRKVISSAFRSLEKFQDEAAKSGKIRRVFVGSMMDIFEKAMPCIDSQGIPDKNDTGYYRQVFLRWIDEGRYQNLLFLLLTKRPSNILKYIPERWKTKPPVNVMFGTSPSDQATFDTLIGQIEKVPGRKFLSIEPQIGPINIGNPHFIDWIIQGGESGPNRRQFDIEWAADMRKQCARAGIPYFFKQIDKVIPIPDYLLIRQFPPTDHISPKFQMPLF